MWQTYITNGIPPFPSGISLRSHVFGYIEREMRMLVLEKRNEQ